MIPLLWFAGLVLARWWPAALLVGTIGWPLLLLADGASAHVGEAAAFGFLNTALGVAAHQVLRGLVRLLRRDS
jgi:hypothetical protein